MIEMADYPDFFTSNLRKARKQHRCYECFRQIEAKEEYENVVGKWDGQISGYKTCSFCLVARKWLSKECGGYVYSCVLEDLREHWNDRYRMNHLGKLIVGMNRKWDRVARNNFMRHKIGEVLCSGK